MPELRQGDPMSVIAWARKLRMALEDYTPPPPDASPPDAQPPPDAPYEDPCHEHEVILTAGVTPYDIPDEYSCMDLTVRADPFADNGVVRLPVAKPGRWIGLTIAGQIGPVVAPASCTLMTRSGDSIGTVPAPGAGNRGYLSVYCWCYGYPVRWTWTTPRTWTLPGTATDET